MISPVYKLKIEMEAATPTPPAPVSVSPLRTLRPSAYDRNRAFLIRGARDEVRLYTMDCHGLLPLGDSITSVSMDEPRDGFALLALVDGARDFQFTVTDRTFGCVRLLIKTASGEVYRETVHVEAWH